MSNTLSLQPIVNVTISLQSPGSPGASFNQPLIVGPSTIIPNSERIRAYTSTSEMTADGFLPNSPELTAASIVFGQQPAPGTVWVGMQDLTAIGTVAVGSGGNGYAVGDILNIIQSGASGGQVKVTSVDGSSAVTGVQLVGTGTMYTVASALVTSAVTPATGTGCTINILTVSETPAGSIMACRQRSSIWYECIFVGTVTDQQQLDIATYVEGAIPYSLYFASASDPKIPAGTTPNLLDSLKSGAFRRTYCEYATTQGGLYPSQAYAAAAPMGVVAGRTSFAAGTYFNLMFKPISGIYTEPLSPTEVLTISGSPDRSVKGYNGNVYLDYADGSYQFIQNGTMSDGTFVDQVIFMDILANLIQVNCMNLLVALPAVPITNGGVAMMQNAVTEACAKVQEIGFIAPSGFWQGQTIGTGNNSISAGSPLPKGFYVYAPSVSTLSQADRAARRLPPITVAVIQAQSAQSLVVVINVQQ